MTDALMRMAREADVAAFRDVYVRSGSTDLVMRLKEASLVAASAGNLEVLRHIREICPDLPWDSVQAESVIGRAAAAGHTAVLDWLRDGGSDVAFAPYKTS